jgi:hypothetical protein
MSDYGNLRWLLALFWQNVHKRDGEWIESTACAFTAHASSLVKDVQRNLIESMENTVTELIAGLRLAWSAWGLSLRRRNEFGANSFGLIALAQCLIVLMRSNCEGVKGD